MLWTLEKSHWGLRPRVWGQLAPPALLPWVMSKTLGLHSQHQLDWQQLWVAPMHCVSSMLVISIAAPFPQSTGHRDWINGEDETRNAGRLAESVVQAPSPQCGLQKDVGCSTPRRWRWKATYRLSCPHVGRRGQNKTEAQTIIMIASIFFPT